MHAGGRGGEGTENGGIELFLVLLVAAACAGATQERKEGCGGA